MANRILAGSKFSNAHARNMLRGILEEVHRAVPLVKIDQHVDDLAQCAVGRQTAVIKQMVLHHARHLIARCGCRVSSGWCVTWSIANGLSPQCGPYHAGQD